MLCVLLYLIKTLTLNFTLKNYFKMQLNLSTLTGYKTFSKNKNQVHYLASGRLFQKPSCRFNIHVSAVPHHHLTALHRPVQTSVPEEVRRGSGDGVRPVQVHAVDALQGAVPVPVAPLVYVGAT